FPEARSMPVPPRLNIVTLCTRDPRRLGAFYASLGWEDLVPGNEDYFQFRTAGAIVAVWAMPEALAETGEGEPAPEGVFRGFTMAINVNDPAEVDSTIDAARQAGASRIVDPKATDWGGRVGYFFDPDGNAWEVAWNPALPVDERGIIAPA